VFDSPPPCKRSSRFTSRCLLLFYALFARCLPFLAVGGIARQYHTAALAGSRPSNPTDTDPKIRDGQEFIIPHIADQLMFDKDDPTGEKDLTVKGAYEPNNIHIEGGKASRVGLAIRPFRCTIPDSLAGTQIHL